MLNAWLLTTGVWLAAALVAILPWGQEVGRGDVAMAVVWLLLALVCFMQARRTSSRSGK